MAIAAPPVSDRPPPPPLAPAGRSRRRVDKLGIAFALPTIGVLGFLLLYPLANGIRLSFLDADNLLGEGEFIGLDHFRLLLSGGLFWDALFKGVIWTVGTVTLELVLGVAAALTLNREFYGRSLARGLILTPYLAPIVVTAFVWRWMFDVDKGVINSLAQDSGLVENEIYWLSRMPMAMVAVILVSAWHFFPFTALSVLGRLQSIPDHLYEAARIDSAGVFARFWDVTRPALGQVILTVLMFRVLWAFNDFGTIYLLTGGGPVNGTRTLPLLVYEYGFRQFNVGLAAAIAVLMMLILSIFLAAYIRFGLRTKNE